MTVSNLNRHVRSNESIACIWDRDQFELSLASDGGQLSSHIGFRCEWNHSLQSIDGRSSRIDLLCPKGMDSLDQHHRQSRSPSHRKSNRSANPFEAQCTVVLLRMRHALAKKQRLGLVLQRERLTQPTVAFCSRWIFVYQPFRTPTRAVDNEIKLLQEIRKPVNSFVYKNNRPKRFRLRLKKAKVVRHSCHHTLKLKLCGKFSLTNIGEADLSSWMEH